MSGMANNITPNLSDYESRTVMIEVSGISQCWIRNSHYVMKVSYSRLSNAIQQINRMGGKIISVKTALNDANTIDDMPEVLQDEPLELVPEEPGAEAKDVQKNSKKGKKSKSRR
jgi:phycocyanin-associated, rod